MLRARLDAKGRPTTAPAPPFVSDSIWSFHLAPAAGGTATRLVVRGRGGGAPRGLLAFGDAIFWDPAHWLMQTKQFRELRRRVSAG